MKNEQTSVLVVRDGAGDYFLLPTDVLERGRVPEARKAEVAQLLDEPDVSGYYARQLHEVVTTVFWATELGAMTVGKVLAGMAFEAAYGSPESPTAPA
jgi:hypothetical protein